MSLGKLNNLSLPATILIASIILGGLYYVSEVNKQKSIEKQQQIKIGQEKKEYIVKRKQDCYNFETSERKKYNNVDGSFYDEENDVCEVRYVNKKWREGDPNSCGLFESLLKDHTCTIEHYFTNEF